MANDEFIKTLTTLPIPTDEDLIRNNLIHCMSDEVEQTINTVFEKYKITNKCVALYGDWAVSEIGDVVNINKKCAEYPILSNNPMLDKEDDIFSHLEGKTWFDAEQRRNLVYVMMFLEQLNR